ncbi:hypothetical protein FSW04_20350 [Baekduia soli]|uniref:Uncharacterized protein n=1 Tax=Baekduia soli TaxID=496014 RepID=A0A5B8U980_9ACTN|nr:hypothetical protein [Baekduia soli]QEC49696.1 hypothetical protein FSW04_20350 [Baekduia soli]
MPRLPGRKAVPWMMVLEAAVIARDHWGRLEPADRRELARIVKKSQGRPSNVTAAERSELRRIVARLDLFTAGRKLMPFRGGLRRSKRR